MNFIYVLGFVVLKGKFAPYMIETYVKEEVA